MSVERNDVDITKLFNWYKTIKIKDSDDEEDARSFSVTIRILGDADVNRARTYALRKSAELRKKLKDENSDEHLAFIQPKDVLDEDKLVELLLILSTKSVTEKVSKEVRLPYPKEPKSDAPTEAFEKYQEEVDNYPGKRLKLIQDKILEELENLRKSYTNMTFDEKYNLYRKLMIDELCEVELLSKFKEATIFYATFRDETFEERFFSSVEAFENLPTKIKLQFIDAYDNLDLSTAELKK